jgi:hypothetical protein
MREKVARMIRVVAALVLTAAATVWLGVGCENGGSGNALTVEPANSMIGRNIVQFTLAITGGMRDLSQPIEWSVADPALGRLEHRGGPTVVYFRSAQNGLQVVHARDQYGVEGTAVIEQISQDTEAPGTATAQQVTGDTTGGGTGGTTGGGTGGFAGQLSVANGEPALLVPGGTGTYSLQQSNVQYDTANQATSFDFSYVDGSQTFTGRIYEINRDSGGQTTSYKATINGQSYAYP